MIFSVKENTLLACGRIFPGDGMDFVSTLAELEAKYDHIFVDTHCNGGSVFDGNLIFNAIQNSKKEIDLQIIGIAGSMMAIIVQSGKKRPKMVRNGFIMVHAPSGSTEGTALDHESNAKVLNSMQSNFIKTLSKSTGKPESYVAKWMVGDNWFDAEQALKEGLISEIIEPVSDTITANANPQELGIEGMYYQFAALLTTKNESQTNLENTMKKPIIDALALVGVSEQSSDTAVIEAVKVHYDAKLKTVQDKLTIAEAAQKVAEDKLTAYSKTAVDTLIADAKKAGKITDKDIATYEGIAASSGFEALTIVLAAIPARKTITGQIEGKTAEPVAGREAWDFDKWQKEDPRGFEALAKENPEAFQELLTKKHQK